MGWQAALGQAMGGRALQEDSGGFAIDASGDYGYAVVADGLGGHAAGEVASAVAVATAAAVWGRDAGKPQTIDPAAFVTEVVKLAHQRVATLNSETGSDAKTTICCVFLSKGLATIGNVGDSRAYLIRGRKISRLSRDHSVPEMLLAQGEITEEQVRGHPDGNRLTQALGADEPPRPFLVNDVTVPGGGRLLLCTDGVWQSLAPQQMAALAGQSAEALALAASSASGPGGDNATAVVINRDGSALERLAGWLRL